MARREEAPDHEGEEVLSPEELDIAADENVATLGDGRFVVGPDGPPNEAKVEQVRTRLADAVESSDADPGPTDERSDDSQGLATATTEDDRPLSGRNVKVWIDRQLNATDSRYAYRIAAKSGDRISHQQLASDDIGTTFDALLLWYAQQVGDGTAVEEVLGILLAESNVRVTYPIQGFLSYLDENDLGPDDSIADLLRTVQQDDGLVFQPTQR